VTVSKILHFESLHLPQGPRSRRGRSCHLGFIHIAEIWESLEASTGVRWHLYFPLVPLKFTCFFPPILAKSVLSQGHAWAPHRQVLVQRLGHSCSRPEVPPPQLVRPSSGQHSSRSVCVPRSPLQRNGAEGGQRLPAFSGRRS